MRSDILLTIVLGGAIIGAAVFAIREGKNSEPEGFSPVDTSAAGKAEDDHGKTDDDEPTMDDYWSPLSSSKDDVAQYKDKVLSSFSNVSAKNELNATEFLPQELNVSWFDKDFNQIKEVDTDNLIDISQYAGGVDTVGQSLKNPSYDIRGNIPNPKSVISPFLNSSIEPDTNIKSWC